MKRYMRLSVLLLSFVMTYCGSAALREFSVLDIYIPAGINITDGELRNRLEGIKLAGGSGYTLRITVYGYSPGAEVMSFSDGKSFSSSRGRAWIKGLIQVIKDDEIISADFVDVSGENREEALDSFASRIRVITGEDVP